LLHRPTQSLDLISRCPMVGSARESAILIKPALSHWWCLGLLLIALWAGVVAGGFFVLHGYEAAPGQAGEPPSCWPATSRIQRATDRPVLLLFAHPRCPCTRATIGELALIMTRCQDKLQAHVLFYKPAGTGPDWEQTDTWWGAGDIPGVQVAVDLDGVEAARFSAKTSGHVLLYGQDGKLLFTGGITASRGHAGDNAGRSAIVSLVTGGVPEAKGTWVFGCPIAGANAPLHKEPCCVRQAESTPSR
jgi:hypothetical protein